MRCCGAVISAAFLGFIAWPAMAIFSGIVGGMLTLAAWRMFARSKPPFSDAIWADELVSNCVIVWPFVLVLTAVYGVVTLAPRGDGPLQWRPKQAILTMIAIMVVAVLGVPVVAIVSSWPALWWIDTAHVRYGWYSGGRRITGLSDLIIFTVLAWLLLVYSFTVWWFLRDTRQCGGVE